MNAVGKAMNGARNETGRWLYRALACSTLWAQVLAAQAAAPHPAAAFRARGEPVLPTANGAIICEAEEFTVLSKGWEAHPWGENYYAATFANTFLSRKAFLGAPEQCEKDSVAAIDVDVKQAGRYLVLARYEAPYRFEAQFRVKVEQGGKVLLDRLYGARQNLKIWAFGEKLKTEVAWGWGAVENMVWEGYLDGGKGAYADLQPGRATISLIAGKQQGLAARRNVDLIMLTTDEKQVQERVNTEGYLPLDGLLTQEGDVWLKVANTGKAKLDFIASMSQHSPYFIHLRKWQQPQLALDPGQVSEWTDFGAVMDSLNDGQWRISASGPCILQVGVSDAAGKIQKIRELALTGNVSLIALADMRYSRKAQTIQEGIDELAAFLKSIPMRGKSPTMTQIFAHHTEADIGKGIDPIYQFCNNLYPVESLGDEIALPVPDDKAVKEGYVPFLKAQRLKPEQADPAAGGDWAKVRYSVDPAGRASNPSVYYWSKRFFYHYGIQAQGATTRTKLQANPKLLVGANYSPHHGFGTHTYLGEVFKWVTCFREGGMNLPWAEDYIWQVPVGSPQMNGINLDLFRAGLRGKPDGKIMYYVMAHMPGNTPAMWRRMFLNATGHGAKIFNLFLFEPVWTAYTENHVTGKEMYGEVLKSFREYGLYEDIAQTGRVRPSEVGLWFSETADIWDDYEQSGGAAKRALYIAILNRQVPIDVVVEQDALDGTLNQYKALYLADRHVSQAASKKLAEWVTSGGQLFATAGAGMFDEYDRPNAVLRELMGVKTVEMTAAPKEGQVRFIKQDLPFAEPMETVVPATNLWTGVIPAFGVVSRVTAAPDAAILGRFRDNSPAILTRAAGKGGTVYCAFLPGLSYFKPAIPLRPVDRGSADQAFAHFIPTEFDTNVGALVGLPVRDRVRPAQADNPLVEASVIESPKGKAIVLVNWSGKALPGMKLTVRLPGAGKAELASGAKVRSAKDGEATVFTFDMDISGDTLILR